VVRNVLAALGYDDVCCGASPALLQGVTRLSSEKTTWAMMEKREVNMDSPLVEEGVGRWEEEWEKKLPQEEKVPWQSLMG
jgi:hypothetical protein